MASFNMLLNPAQALLINQNLLVQQPTTINMGQGPLNPMMGLMNPGQSLFGTPQILLAGRGGNSIGYMGYIQQKEQGTQNAFDALRRRMESDSKAASSKAETQASLGDGSGIFSPLNTYDRSAVGSWEQGGQGYVSQPGLNMLF